MDIRKTVTLIEDILIEDGKPLAKPLRRVAQIAVVLNPLVGRDDENLDELVHDGEDLGRFLAQRALESIERSRIATIGKGAIVGTDGEPEHGQAILYPKFASAVRETLGLGSAPILSEKLIAGAGAAIKVHLRPIGGMTGDQSEGLMEVRVPGSPRPEEILVALVVAGYGGTQSS